MKIFRYQDFDGEMGWLGEAGDGTSIVLQGNLYEGLEPTGESAVVERILTPVDPVAIICIGLNYRAHAAETKAELPKWPVVFFKNPGAIQNPDDPIVLPRWLRSTQVDYEAELAVVIGRPCRNVRREEALDYVLGYTCGNDVSARDWQKLGGGGQWCRGKSFDTFCPLGPCLVTPDELENPNRLEIRCKIGDEIVQESNTSEMIFSVAELIEFLSGSTTLLPGTVILTGTPSGVGMSRNPQRWLKAGDRVTVEIEGIGSLTNPVLEESVDGMPSSFVLPR